MAQENLNDLHLDVLFQKSRGVTVTKGVGGEERKPCFLSGPMEGGIDRPSADRVALGPVGKDPGRISMGGPGLAQAFQE